MNKKVEIWVLYLFILIGFICSIFFGVLVRDAIVKGTNAPLISKTALVFAEIPSNLKKLLKGLTLKDRFPDLEGFTGNVHEENIYLLLTRYDGDISEGIVELIDLQNFKVLHTWNPDLNKMNSFIDKSGHFKYLNRDSNDSREVIAHPMLLSNGSLLFQSGAIRYIDSCSNLIDQNYQHLYHHSIEEDIDGNIWVPAHLYPQSLPPKLVGRELIQEGGFYDDAIVKISPNGEIIFQKSVAQIYIDNGLEYLLFGHGNDYDPDPIHLNDIQPVNFDGKFWKKGDVFLSPRNQSTIILYRPSSNKIIWKGNGPFFHQHDIDILDNHRISIFDNNSKNIANNNNTNKVDGNSRVVIYDFEKNSFSYYLNNSLIDHDVRTVTGGRSEILPNGDLYILESNSGRILYYNSDGTLKWSFVNKGNNKKLYRVGWSRILYKEIDIKRVESFLNNKVTCNE